jgi:hypothetical protein
MSHGQSRTRWVDVVGDVARTWVGRIAVYALDALVLLLIFPNEPALLAVLLGVAAVSTFVLIAVRRRPMWPPLVRRALTAFSVVALMADVAAGAVGPVLRQQQPVYVFLSPDRNPLNARVVRAPFEHVPVVVLTDPVRKALRPLWEHLGPYRVRMLSFDATGGGLVSFPINGAYLVEDRLPAGISSRQLEIPFLAPRVIFDVQPAPSRSRAPRGPSCAARVPVPARASRLRAIRGRRARRSA